MSSKLHGFFFHPPISANYLGHQFAEIYRDGVYAPFVEEKKGLTILEIGANVGITSYYFSQFAKKVYSVEPSKEHFDTLSRMILFNDLKNIIPINKALYINSGELPLYHNKNKTMYSLHAAVDDKSIKPETVECITIEELMKEHKIKKVDLMKLDIEGSEYEVLGHTAFKNVADRIKTILVERHAWSGRNENQLVDSLKAVGYQVSQIPNSADLLIAQR